MRCAAAYSNAGSSREGDSKSDIRACSDTATSRKWMQKVGSEVRPGKCDLILEQCIGAYLMCTIEKHGKSDLLELLGLLPFFNHIYSILPCLQACIYYLLCRGHECIVILMCLLSVKPHGAWRGWGDARRTVGGRGTSKELRMVMTCLDTALLLDKLY